MNYFIFLGKVLPCVYCRNSYQKFIKNPNTLLSMDTMRSRETVTKWGFKLHNTVNNKLGVDYGETYEEMCYKYESYRARCTKTDKGCIMPLDLKAKSYHKAAMQRAPIIDIKYCEKLKKYAHEKGLKNYDKFLTYYTGLTRNTAEWGMRDCVARKIIRFMRKNGISALNTDNMPSTYEMLLISMLSSTLEKNQLDEICKNIDESIY